MSKRKCKVNEHLFTEFPFLTNGKSIHHVFCGVCNSHISIGNKGRMDITEHMSTMKHNRNLQRTTSTSSVLQNLITSNDNINCILNSTSGYRHHRKAIKPKNWNFSNCRKVPNPKIVTTMNACAEKNCEHLLTLNLIQTENLDLKKEILNLKTNNVCSTCEENEKHLLDINKENQELFGRLSISKQMIAELHPKLTQVLQSVQNIEQALHWEKSKQNELVCTVTSAVPPRSGSVRNPESNQEDESSFFEIGSLEINHSENDFSLTNEKAANVIPVTLEPKIESLESEEAMTFNEKSLTDVEDSLTGSSVILPTETPSSLDYLSNASSTETISVLRLQNLPEKSSLPVCSFCHENFQNFKRSDFRTDEEPPCCERCKVLLNTKSSLRAISFLYPKISSITTSASEVWESTHEVINFTETDELATQSASEKLYQCNVCGKAFTRPHSLTRHVRIHTGERPYECEICGKHFNVSGALASHVRIHTGEKPFECKICGKRFAESTKLKNHHRLHTGEKPFKCEVCDRRFSQMTNLNTHCRRHLNEVRNRCDKCGNGFWNIKAMREHRCVQILDSAPEVHNKSDNVLDESLL